MDAGAARGTSVRTFRSRRTGCRGPASGELAFLPQGSKELWGALTAPLPAPPIAASGAGLCHLSLPTRPGRAPPLCRWGRLLPVAETDDIFISLSKPPLFMEVSPG